MRGTAGFSIQLPCIDKKRHTRYNKPTETATGPGDGFHYKARIFKAERMPAMPPESTPMMQQYHSPRPGSAEEEVTRDYLLSGEADVTLVVASWSIDTAVSTIAAALDIAARVRQSSQSPQTLDTAKRTSPW